LAPSIKELQVNYLTVSGKSIDLLNIKGEDITIEDIAHSLSNQCRFGGHTRQFYSVAQHSLRVAQALPSDLKLTGLLHDAAEAYVIDLPLPIKRSLPEYCVLEDAVWAVIGSKFQLKDKDHWLIKMADKMALRTEIEDFFTIEEAPHLLSYPRLPPQSPMNPKEAASTFLASFFDYTSNL
jgi:hypothetical protein